MFTDIATTVLSLFIISLLGFFSFSGMLFLWRLLKKVFPFLREMNAKLEMVIRSIFVLGGTILMGVSVFLFFIDDSMVPTILGVSSGIVFLLGICSQPYFGVGILQRLLGKRQVGKDLEKFKNMLFYATFLFLIWMLGMMII